MVAVTTKSLGRTAKCTALILRRPVAESQVTSAALGIPDRSLPLSLMAGSMVIGSAPGIYGTAMFRWAGIPNAFSNVTTVPGAVIRVNSAAMGKAAGSAAQDPFRESTNR